MDRVGVLLPLCIGAALLCQNCRGEDSAEVKYIPWTSTEYKKITKEWKYTPDAAYALCRKYDADHGREGGSVRHVTIAGDCYLFSANISKTKSTISLVGYYVNGKTGTVEFRGDGELSEERQVELWGAKCWKSYPLKRSQK